MRKILNAILLLLFLGVPSSQSGQGSTGTGTPDRGRRDFALAFVRTLNTVEVVEKETNGSYTPWATLLAHHEFDGFMTAVRRQVPDATWGNLDNADITPTPEILPGWGLRMNLHADGYDVRLQDLTDKKCGYAVFSDETYMIRQSILFESVVFGHCVPVN
jgi:hypothetical protein